MGGLAGIVGVYGSFSFKKSLTCFVKYRVRVVLACFMIVWALGVARLFFWIEKETGIGMKTMSFREQVLQSQQCSLSSSVLAGSDGVVCLCHRFYWSEEGLRRWRR